MEEEKRFELLDDLSSSSHFECGALSQTQPLFHKMAEGCGPDPQPNIIDPVV